MAPQYFSMWVSLWRIHSTPRNFLSSLYLVKSPCALKSSSPKTVYRYYNLYARHCANIQIAPYSVVGTIIILTFQMRRSGVWKCKVSLNLNSRMLRIWITWEFWLPSHTERPCDYRKRQRGPVTILIKALGLWGRPTFFLIKTRVAAHEASQCLMEMLNFLLGPFPNSWPITL